MTLNITELVLRVRALETELAAEKAATETDMDKAVLSKLLTVRRRRKYQSSQASRRRTATAQTSEMLRAELR